MIELLTYTGVLVAGAVFGFEIRPLWEQRQMEHAAEQAKEASREKRSASAKEAAARRAKAREVAMAAGVRLNGSGNATKDAS